ncbi:MAG: ABC transporter permease [Verrucomicrobiota bacterium]
MRAWTELVESLRMSGEALAANKLRSALATIGIVIGIVTVTLMGTAIAGINKAFKQSISVLGSDVMYVNKAQWFIDSHEEWLKVQRRQDITWAQYEAVQKQMTLARAIAPMTGLREPIRYKNRRSDGVVVLGTTEEFIVTSGLSVIEGRFMTPAEADGGRPVVVLGFQVATNLFVNESAIGKKLKIGNETLDVIGVLEAQGTFLGDFSWDNRVIIPARLMANDFIPFPDYEIHVKAISVEKLNEAREELRGIMRKVRKVKPGQEDDFAINEQDMLLNTFNRVAGRIATGGLFITGLSLFVGGIGIMNIMFVSVAERTREIGIRKAIGAKKRTILLQFLIEAAGICVMGGLIGLAIAIPITFLLKKFMPATISLQIISVALLVAIVTGLVSGFLPAWRAARMNPVDALRNE